MRWFSRFQNTISPRPPQPISSSLVRQWSDLLFDLASNIVQFPLLLVYDVQKDFTATLAQQLSSSLHMMSRNILSLLHHFVAWKVSRLRNFPQYPPGAHHFHFIPLNHVLTQLIPRSCLIYLIPILILFNRISKYLLSFSFFFVPYNMYFTLSPTHSCRFINVIGHNGMFCSHLLVHSLILFTLN